MFYVIIDPAFLCTDMSILYETCNLQQENPNCVDGAKVCNGSQRIYNKVQNEMSAVIDAVSSTNTCKQPFSCDDDQSFATD